MLRIINLMDKTDINIKFNGISYQIEQNSPEILRNVRDGFRRHCVFCEGQECIYLIYLALDSVYLKTQSFYLSGLSNPSESVKSASHFSCNRFLASTMLSLSYIRLKTKVRDGLHCITLTMSKDRLKAK